MWGITGTYSVVPGQTTSALLSEKPARLLCYHSDTNTASPCVASPCVVLQGREKPLDSCILLNAGDMGAYSARRRACVYTEGYDASHA